MSLKREQENLKETYNRLAQSFAAETPDIWRLTTDIWQNEQEAIGFLTSPNIFLGGKSPLALLVEDKATNEPKIKQYLGQIKYGVYT